MADLYIFGAKAFSANILYFIVFTVLQHLKPFCGKFPRKRSMFQHMQSREKKNVSINGIGK